MTTNIKAELVAGKLAEYEQLSKIYDDIVKQARPRITVEGQGKILLALADEDHLSQNSWQVTLACRRNQRASLSINLSIVSWSLYPSPPKIAASTL